MSIVKKVSNDPFSDMHAFSIALIGFLAVAAAGFGAVAWALGGTY